MTESYRDSLKIPEDFDDLNDLLGLELHRMTEVNGVSCYSFFKGVREAGSTPKQGTEPGPRYERAILKFALMPLQCREHAR